MAGELSSTNIRWACAGHLLGRLQAHGDLDGVLIVPGFPGADNVRARSIWLDEIISEEIRIPVATGGRKVRDDKFRLPWFLQVVDAPSLDSTMEQLSTMFAAFEDVLADSPTLDDFPSVVSAEVTDESMTSGVRPDGPIGYGRIIVSIHSRLH